MNTDFARRKMVEQQVRVWDVHSPQVLRVLSKVEREQFVPAGCEDVAYADTEIPLPHGQVMLRPIIEGQGGHAKAASGNGEPIQRRQARNAALDRYIEVPLSINQAGSPAGISECPEFGFACHRPS